jgi:hypothetical protein
MASRGKRVAAAGAAAYSLKDNPAVQRFVQDEQVRENLRIALESARKVYGRVSDGKAPSDLLNDKKLQKELSKSADALRDATSALQEGPRGRRGGGIARLLLLTIVGAVVALVVSEDLRNRVLDMLFGAEEEFDYTSTTTPASPPPASTTGAAPIS